MKKALLLGCATTSYMTHQKGIDSFTQSHHNIGGQQLIAALASGGWEVVHVPSPSIATAMPTTLDELGEYDVIIISDVGSNTFLLSPTTTSARPDIDRLALIADYVRSGGGLLMIGGYFAFSGVNAVARYGATRIAPVLPVELLDVDDRVEVPAGASGHVQLQHELVAHLPVGDWPILLGYNRTKAKPESTTIVSIQDDPLLSVMQVGAGRVAVFTSDFAPHWAPTEFTEWSGYPILWNAIADWLGTAARVGDV